MRKMKSDIVRKSILTGIIYAVTTCVVQVPVANIIFGVLNITPKSIIEDEMLPLLIFSIFVIGIAMALFYYMNGHLFFAESKWKQGLKFGIFVYMSNYVPQVLFLDANKGLSTLISGGFEVIQVELFDFIILIITVLLMVLYMPCCREIKYDRVNKMRKKYILCGVVFALVMVVLQEIIMPIFGIKSMAQGLNVSNENKRFFYIVMISGFILAGFLVSKYTCLAKNIDKKEKFCIGYSVLIWCTFDLTMIPLGFGVIATIVFILVSMASFISIEFLCRWFIKKTSC